MIELQGLKFEFQKKNFLLLPTFEKVNLEEENKRKIGNKQKYGGRKPVLETAEQKIIFYIILL
ncbi:MAG: hypothetical protein Q9M97_03045 [Candidatus Gracilibacteria bacterium]|nr:hypothetical protein [Candidatus Gracilibacteria bacterium]